MLNATKYYLAGAKRFPSTTRYRDYHSKCVLLYKWCNHWTQGNSMIDIVTFDVLVPIAVVYSTERPDQEIRVQQSSS